jgi:hypothetical protein
MTLTDKVTHATFSSSTLVNIVGALGTNTAYVGLTGADGGISSTQVISNFQFASLVSLSGQATPTNAVMVTWLNSAGGLVLQQAQTLASAWAFVTNPVVADALGNNQMFIAPPAGPRFYRLATP